MAPPIHGRRIRGGGQDSRANDAADSKGDVTAEANQPGRRFGADLAHVIAGSSHSSGSVHQSAAREWLKIPGSRTSVLSL